MESELPEMMNDHALRRALLHSHHTTVCLEDTDGSAAGRRQSRMHGASVPAR